MSILKDLIKFVIFVFFILIIGNNSEFYISGIYILITTSLYIFHKTKLNENIKLKKEVISQKEYFTKILEHDFKVPEIAQLRGLEILEKEALGSLNKEQKDFIIQIKQANNKMLDMISNVKHFYRYENNNVTLIYEKFSFTTLLNECIKDFAPLLAEKNLTLLFNKMQNNVYLYADSVEIKLLIKNLLYHAISYSLNGETIEIYAKEFNEKLKFTLKTKGIKFLEKESLAIFNKTTHDINKFSVIGNNLGLYLCKKIVEAHNGKINLLSCDTNFNCINFSIPLSKPEITLPIQIKTLQYSFIKFCKHFSFA